MLRTFLAGIEQLIAAGPAGARDSSSSSGRLEEALQSLVALQRVEIVDDGIDLTIYGVRHILTYLQNIQALSDRLNSREKYFTGPADLALVA